MSQNGVRKFRRGDLIFSENEAITALLFVNSGRVKYFIPRGSGIDLQTLNAPFVIGELALFSTARYPLSAVAMTDVTVFEMPLKTARQTLDTAPQFFKTLTKGLVEQVRTLLFELRSQKLEFDPTPCPSEIIPRLFGGIYHTIKHLGHPIDDQTLEVDWGAMKKYTNRIFNLPQDKVEGVNNIMAKFGSLDFNFSQDSENPEAPPQLSTIVYKDVSHLESFFDFYQFYFYRGGRQEILKFDEPVFNIVRGLYELSKEASPDKTGTVKIDLDAHLDFLKKEHALNVSASHWQLLEAKGLFTKRSQTSDGKSTIAFHLEDVQKTYQAWRFLREIHKWNNTGAINPTEPEFPAPAPSATLDSQCPDCKTSVNQNQKFCSQCGAKLTASSVA